MLKPLLALALALLSPLALAADSALGDHCDLKALSVPDKQGFLAFDRDLRAALQAENAAALAMLVEFPLSLNHGDGAKTAFVNPTALILRFREAFPEDVRTAVLQQRASELFCNARGIAYGEGRVWVEVSGGPKRPQYRVATVNLKTLDDDRARTLAYVCETEKHRVAVDSDGDWARYRAWEKPRSPIEPPSLELLGSQSVEGSGECAHPVWTFDDAGTRIVVSEGGCSDEHDEAVTGDLSIQAAGKPEQAWKCY